MQVTTPPRSNPFVLENVFTIKYFAFRYECNRCAEKRSTVTLNALIHEALEVGEDEEGDEGEDEGDEGDGEDGEEILFSPELYNL
jgi:Ran GTPase-activating protein (RanGAP) involved in mRNA processing and transport